MLWVYRADGQTLKFDLCSSGHYRDWKKLEADPDFQAGITGLALYNNDDLQTLTGPTQARRCRFKADAGKKRNSDYERITLELDDYIFSITAYRNGAVPRVTSIRARRGRLRYQPKEVINGD